MNYNLVLLAGLERDKREENQDYVTVQQRFAKPIKALLDTLGKEFF